MPSKQPVSNARTEIGRDLARKMYDYKLKQLINLSPAEKDGLKSEFPMLGQAEFDNILEQVIAAKTYEQERVGWQAIPHDVSVLIFVALTCLVNLRIGVIVGVGAIVLLESLFQFYFYRPLYRYLSLLVWLTYPAYILLAYVLYHRGYERIWVLAIVALAWGGSFLFGIIARLPVRMVMEAKARNTKRAVQKK